MGKMYHFLRVGISNGPYSGGYDRVRYSNNNPFQSLVFFLEFNKWG